jgi:hypothetical protein
MAVREHNDNWTFNATEAEELRCHIHRYIMKKKIGACEVIEACASVMAATLAADFCPCCQAEVVRDFARIIEAEAAEITREEMH